MRLYHRLAAVTAAVALVVADGLAVAPAASTAASHHLYHVAIGVDLPYPLLEINKFVPDHLTVHVGDSVQFTNINGNSPQTITFGSVTNTPALIIDSNAGEINPFVVKAQGGRSIADTSQNTYSSGALLSGVSGFSTSYTFTFPKQGTYFYRSLFHPSTLGEIDVVAANKPASSDTPDRGPSLRDALRSLSSLLNGSIGPEAQSANSYGGSGNVLIGLGDQNVSVNKFTPSGIVLPISGTVTWRIKESSGDLHALVFFPTGAESSARVKLFTGRAADGGLIINPAYRTASLVSQTIVDTDTQKMLQQRDGGRWTSGILYNGPPDSVSQVPSSYSITFAVPGQYTYVDPFHLGMDGVITVVRTAFTSS